MGVSALSLRHEHRLLRLLLGFESTSFEVASFASAHRYRAQRVHDGHSRCLQHSAF
jgi:hypothetical protein